MFRKGWDADEEHLNPMAYVALHRIHIFLGQDEEAQNWKTYLDREEESLPLPANTYKPSTMH